MSENSEKEPEKKSKGKEIPWVPDDKQRVTIKLHKDEDKKRIKEEE